MVVRIIQRFQTHNDEKVSKINCVCNQNFLQLFSMINLQTKKTKNKPSVVDSSDAKQN